MIEDHIVRIVSALTMHHSDLTLLFPPPGKLSTLAVDTIVLCAGQEVLRELHEPLLTGTVGSVGGSSVLIIFYVCYVDSFVMRVVLI